METDTSFDNMDVNGFPIKLAQCRICHDEDETSNMEAPCSCCGSLKYAHRRCVQMWCNQKGNTMCEICLQQFNPDYSVPPPRLPFTVIPLPLREPWEFARRHQFNHPTIIAAESIFDHRFDDYTTPTASIICCRIVTIIFVVLVVLRHTLPIIYNGADEGFSFTLYTLLMLRSVAILLPMFVMLKAFSIIRHHRRHRPTPAAFYHSSSDEENEFVQPQASAHFIHIQ